MRTEKTISLWAKALVLTQEGKTGDEKKEIIKRLAEVFKKRKKEHLLPEIIRRAGKLFLKSSKLELTLAREQGEDTLKKIKSHLTELFGKDKEIAFIFEKDIIGGFRAKTEKLFIKASVKDFLNEIKNHYK